jgi:succinylglutamic semialdehyde dehydrogenase
VSDTTLISFEPASGGELWRGTHSDVDAAVSTARRAWAAWAARPLIERIEVLRAFANEARRQTEPLAELIARETGKPLWEARTEIDAVVNKVDISVQAYAERTGKKNSTQAPISAPPCATNRTG